MLFILFPLYLLSFCPPSLCTGFLFSHWMELRCETILALSKHQNSLLCVWFLSQGLWFHLTSTQCSCGELQITLWWSAFLSTWLGFIWAITFCLCFSSRSFCYSLFHSESREGTAFIFPQVWNAFESYLEVRKRMVPGRIFKAQTKRTRLIQRRLYKHINKNLGHGINFPWACFGNS